MEALTSFFKSTKLTDKNLQDDTEPNPEFVRRRSLSLESVSSASSTWSLVDANPDRPSVSKDSIHAKKCAIDLTKDISAGEILRSNLSDIAVAIERPGELRDSKKRHITHCGVCKSETHLARDCSKLAAMTRQQIAGSEMEAAFKPSAALDPQPKHAAEANEQMRKVTIETVVKQLLERSSRKPPELRAEVKGQEAESKSEKLIITPYDKEHLPQLAAELKQRRGESKPPNLSKIFSSPKDTHRGKPGIAIGSQLQAQSGCENSTGLKLPEEASVNRFKAVRNEVESARMPNFEQLAQPPSLAERAAAAVEAADPRVSFEELHRRQSRQIREVERACAGKQTQLPQAPPPAKRTSEAADLQAPQYRRTPGVMRRPLPEDAFKMASVFLPSATSSPKPASEASFRPQFNERPRPNNPHPNFQSTEHHHHRSRRCKRVGDSDHILQ